VFPLPAEEEGNFKIWAIEACLFVAEKKRKSHDPFVEMNGWHYNYSTSLPLKFL
jgi:hypothetical protein